MKNKDFGEWLRENCDFESKIDKKTLQIVSELYKKDDDGNFVKHTKEVMDDFFNKASHNNDIQIALCNYPPLNEADKYRLLTFDFLYKSTVEEILINNNMPDTVIDDAIKKLSPSHIDEMLSSDKNLQFNKHFIDTILSSSIEKIKNGRFSDMKPAEVFVFKHIDTNYRLYDLYYKSFEMPEFINNLVASNPKIINEIRDTAFDMGCDWTKIKNITRHMAEEMYKSIVDTLFCENQNIKHGNNKNVAYNLLNKLITSHLLSYVEECDLANNIVKEKPMVQNLQGNSLDVLLMNTSNPSVANIVLKFSYNLATEQNFWLNVLYGNINKFDIPNNLYSYAEKSIKKIFTCEDVGEIENKDIAIAECFAVNYAEGNIKRPLSEKCANLILDNFNNQKLFSIFPSMKYFAPAVIMSKMTENNCITNFLNSGKLSENSPLFVLCNIALACKSKEQKQSVFNNIDYDITKDCVRILSNSCDTSYDQLINVLNESKFYEGMGGFGTSLVDSFIEKINKELKERVSNLKISDKSNIYIELADIKQIYEKNFENCKTEKEINNEKDVSPDR